MPVVFMLGKALRPGKGVKGGRWGRRSGGNDGRRALEMTPLPSGSRCLRPRAAVSIRPARGHAASRAHGHAVGHEHDHAVVHAHGYAFGHAVGHAADPVVKTPALHWSGRRQATGTAAAAVAVVRKRRCVDGGCRSSRGALAERAGRGGRQTAARPPRESPPPSPTTPSTHQSLQLPDSDTAKHPPLLVSCWRSPMPPPARFSSLSRVDGFKSPHPPCRRLAGVEPAAARRPRLGGRSRRQTPSRRRPAMSCLREKAA